jgi:hypothetical protein
MRNVADIGGASVVIAHALGTQYARRTTP